MAAFRRGVLGRRNAVTKQYREIEVWLDDTGDVYTSSACGADLVKDDFSMYVHNLRGVSGVRRLDDVEFAMRSGQGKDYVFRAPDASACDGWIASLLETGWMLDSSAPSPVETVATTTPSVAIESREPYHDPAAAVYPPQVIHDGSHIPRVHVSRHGSVDITLDQLTAIDALTIGDRASTVAAAPVLMLPDSTADRSSGGGGGARNNPFNAEFDAALADTSTWMDSFLSQTVAASSEAALRETSKAVQLAASVPLSPVVHTKTDEGGIPRGAQRPAERERAPENEAQALYAAPQVNDLLPAREWENAVQSRDPRDFSLGEFVACIRIDGSKRYALIADVNHEEGTVNLLVEDDEAEGPMFHYNDPIDPQYIRKIAPRSVPHAPAAKEPEDEEAGEFAGQESFLSFTSVNGDERSRLEEGEEDDGDRGESADASLYQSFMPLGSPGAVPRGGGGGGGFRHGDGGGESDGGASTGATADDGAAVPSQAPSALESESQWQPSAGALVGEGEGEGELPSSSSTPAAGGLGGFSQRAPNVINTPAQTTTTDGELRADSPALPSDSQFNPVATPSGGAAAFAQQQQLQRMMMGGGMGVGGGFGRQPGFMPQMMMAPAQQLAYAQAQYAFAVSNAARAQQPHSLLLPQQQQQQLPLFGAGPGAAGPTPFWGNSSATQDGAELGGSSTAMPISPLAARGMAEAVAAGARQQQTTQLPPPPQQQQQFYWDGSSAAGEPMPSAEPASAADPSALQREIDWCREEITRSRTMYREDIAGLRAELAAGGGGASSERVPPSQQQQQHELAPRAPPRSWSGEADVAGVAREGAAFVPGASARFSHDPNAHSDEWGEISSAHAAHAAHSAEQEAVQAAVQAELQPDSGFQPAASVGNRFSSDPNAGGEWGGFGRGAEHESAAPSTGDGTAAAELDGAVAPGQPNASSSAWDAAPEEARSPRSPKYRGGELPPEEELAREEEERLRSRAEQQLQVELQALREQERAFDALLPKVHAAEREIAALVEMHAQTEARLAEQKQMATQSASDITTYTQQNARAGREETKRQARIADLEKKIRHARVAAAERDRKNGEEMRRRAQLEEQAQSLQRELQSVEERLRALEHENQQQNAAEMAGIQQLRATSRDLEVQQERQRADRQSEARAMTAEVERLREQLATKVRLQLQEDAQREQQRQTQQQAQQQEQRQEQRLPQQRAPQQTQQQTQKQTQQQTQQQEQRLPQQRAQQRAQQIALEPAEQSQSRSQSRPPLQPRPEWQQQPALQSLSTAIPWNVDESPVSPSKQWSRREAPSSPQENVERARIHQRAALAAAAAKSHNQSSSWSFADAAAAEDLDTADAPPQVQRSTVLPRSIAAVPESTGTCQHDNRSMFDMLRGGSPERGTQQRQQRAPPSPPLVTQRQWAPLPEPQQQRRQAPPSPPLVTQQQWAPLPEPQQPPQQQWAPQEPPAQEQQWQVKRQQPPQPPSPQQWAPRTGGRRMTAGVPSPLPQAPALLSSVRSIPLDAGHERFDDMVHERFHDMRSAFLSMDVDHSGRISLGELQDMCVRWNLPRDDVDRVLAVCDVNRDGSISFTEFAEHFGGQRDRSMGGGGVMSDAAASEAMHARIAQLPFGTEESAREAVNWAVHENALVAVTKQVALLEAEALKLENSRTRRTIGGRIRLQNVEEQLAELKRERSRLRFTLKDKPL